MPLSALFTGVESAAMNPPTGVIGCPDCGAIQSLHSPGGHGVIRCFRCNNVLERTAGRSLDGALACALATFMLLFPANILPLLHVVIASATVHSEISSGIIAIGHQGWPLVALVVGLEVVIFPFLRFGSLIVVLGILRGGAQPPWLGRLFRWSEQLDEWAMPDVFLIGSAIGYSRVAPFLPITVGTGGWCLISAALLTLVTRAALEKRAVWRRIRAPEATMTQNMIGCTGCDLAVYSHQKNAPCPRCGLRVSHVRPLALMRSLALAFAGLALYPLAYLYPMEKSDRINSLHPYSIMTGVLKLLHAHLWFFAAIIFIASVVIPLVKLLMLFWFAYSIHFRKLRHVLFQTRTYRAIVGLGRWSHIDVFTVAVFLPLMHLPGFLSVIVGRALPAFLAVVVLTMLATDTFDPRALWAQTPDYE